jgi:hypothetical protein
MLQHQGLQSVRQGKDHVDLGRVEDLARPGREPRGVGGAMTLRTAAVAARVVGLDLVATVVTLGDVAAQGSRATQRDSAQGAVWRARQGGAIAVKEGGAILAGPPQRLRGAGDAWPLLQVGR